MGASATGGNGNGGVETEGFDLFLGVVFAGDSLGWTVSYVCSWLDILIMGGSGGGV